MKITKFTAVAQTHNKLRIMPANNSHLPLLVLALAALLVLPPPSAFAQQLSCTVVDGDCPSGVPALQLSARSNAVASLNNDYPFNVCCSGASDLHSNCSNNFAVFLRLSGQSNAHVEQSDQSNYPISACLGSATNAVVCEYGNVCSPDYTCLVTISGVTNAHVAECGSADSYPTKVCCGLEQTTLGTSILNVTATNIYDSGNTTITVNVQNPEADTTISLRFFDAITNKEISSLAQTGISASAGAHQDSYGPFEAIGNYKVLASIEQPNCNICEKSSIFSVLTISQIAVSETSVFLVLAVSLCVLWIIKTR